MLGINTSAKLVSIISNQNVEGGSGKTEWTKRFHIMKQKFILFALATDVKMAPEEPSPELKMLFEIKREHIQSMVQHSIVTQRSGSQVVDNAYSMALYNRTFHNAESNGPPRGLFIFFAIPVPNIGGLSLIHI